MPKPLSLPASKIKRKRKYPSPRIKLQAMKRDKYSCKICGRSPATHQELSLEVDHIIPFSKGGQDDLSNYQTLCFDCNRGKGNNELFNRTIEDDLIIILKQINPEILDHMNDTRSISVVANQEDYKKLIDKNQYGNPYEIVASTNTLIGHSSGKNLGIYTLQDNRGSKAHFFIKKQKT